MPMPTALERFTLKGRVVILTGGAGFLGQFFARALAEAGAYVVIADVQGDRANSAVNELERLFPNLKFLAVQTDVTDPTSVSKMVQRTTQAFGRIDALVNNAALDPKFDPEHAAAHTASLEDYPLDAWRKSVDVDLTGAFLCTRVVASVMRVQVQGGTIVNISSIYGLVGPDQRLYVPDQPDTARTFKPASYSVSKAALDGFTRYLAAYFAGTNIRVNTLTFGGVFHEHDAEFARRYGERTPLGRMMNTEEVGAPLLFLLSDASSYMTGANLVVDGGWTAW